MTDEVREGSQAGGIWLVEYDEDDWKALPDATKDHCRDTWIKKASALKEVRFVVLKLIPDELFPMHGHEKPYVEWQHAIDRGPEKGYTVETLVAVQLPAPYELSPLLRSRIESELRETHPKGTVWSIRGAAGVSLAMGRI